MIYYDKKGGFFMKISKKVLIIGLLILSIVIALIIYFKNVQNENITTKGN